MKIKTFVFNPFSENTLVLWDDVNNAIIIDPGCHEKHEKQELVDFISSEGLTVVAIVNTHCHIDHVLGNDAMKEHYRVELWVPENEKEILKAIPSYASSYGFDDYTEAKVDHWFVEGGLSFSEMRFKVIEVSGHSPGSMVFYNEASGILVGGDVLFREGIGRTDLPGGNHEDLLRNIKEKIYSLPDDVTVYPGHGPETTIGHEKQFNPFVKA